MNLKELFGGVSATAVMILFTLWTTDWEVSNNGGFVFSIFIVFLVSCTWRIVLNPVISKGSLTLNKVKSYSLGALVASVFAVSLFLL